MQYERKQMDWYMYHTKRMTYNILLAQWLLNEARLLVIGLYIVGLS